MVFYESPLTIIEVGCGREVFTIFRTEDIPFFSIKKVLHAVREAKVKVKTRPLLYTRKK